MLLTLMLFLLGCPATPPAQPVEVSVQTPAAQAAPVTVTQAAPAESKDGIQINAGPDGASIDYKADGSAGGVSTGTDGTEVDLKVEKKK